MDRLSWTLRGAKVQHLVRGATRSSLPSRESGPDSVMQGCECA